MKLLPIQPCKFKKTNNVLKNKNSNNFPLSQLLVFGKDSFIKNEIDDNFNKEVLIKRGIISKDEKLNDFFNDVAAKLFPLQKDKQILFVQLLKEGKISLSSNAYKDLKNPYSAIGIKLDSSKSFIDNCKVLDKYLKKGVGMGFNLSFLDNPITTIKQLNSYFKFSSPSCSRSPSGIGLLDIYNKDILEFIGLKDNAQYKDWCFDLSVIIDDKFLSLVDNDSYVVLSDNKKIKARKIYNKLLNSMLKKGEPGIIFSNSKDYICDCCAAAQLKESETLTIAQINLTKFISLNKEDSFNYNSLEQASIFLYDAIKKLDSNAYISILGYAELLDKLGLEYSSNQANQLLETIIKTIKKNNIKIAISPSGTISRFLKTSPSIEPVIKKGIDNNEKTRNREDYLKEIETTAIAQRLIEGQISKTIILDKNASASDIDSIIRDSKQKGLKGICVFRA